MNELHRPWSAPRVLRIHGLHVERFRLLRRLFVLGAGIDEEVAELPRRFPHLDARGVERAFWMDTGGVLFAQDIVVSLARHLGGLANVTLHENSPVGSADADGAQRCSRASSLSRKGSGKPIG